MNVSDISKRIKRAREMRGLSLQDLSGRLQNKISRQALHKYEKGTAMPDPEMVQDIAQALNLKADYFYREKTVDLNEISFRKLSSLSKKEQNRIIETARDFLERYLELEQIIGKPVEVENPLKNLKIKTNEDVEKAAQKLREAWNLGTDPLYNILELLEDQGIKILELNGDPAIDGFSTWIEDSIPVIGLNKNLKNHLDRYRFTTLHELGHLLLNIDSMEIKQQEKMCHYFAGALLLDKRAAVQELGYKRKHISLQELAALKKQYGISMQAIIYRLRDLKIITETSYQNFFRFMKANGHKEDESRLAVYKGEENALRFDQLLGQALVENHISISKAAALKNQRLTQFRKEFLIG